MSKKGKNFANATKKIEAEKIYEPSEGLALVKEMAFAKFDETVEVHIRTGLDPRQADQQIRDTVVLPHGLGKTVRVLVFAQGEAAVAAREAGAEFVVETDEDLARNLMPNPKAGTVVQPGDISEAIRLAKAGRVEFRLDKSANIHVPIGKVSFSAEKLYDNMAALMNAVVRARPSGAKGAFIRRVALASTMGPGVKVDVAGATSMKPSQL